MSPRYDTLPWERQRNLKQIYAYDEVPSIREINQAISKIQFGSIKVKFQTLRARALVAMYYLTAARLSEITKTTYLFHTKTRKIRQDKRVVAHEVTIEKIPHNYSGIKKNSISYDTIDGHKCMYIRIENRKNKTRKSKKQPIPIEKEKSIAAHVKCYTDQLKPGAVLFDFSPQRAIQIINGTIGWNCHFIRHIRATHLVTKYDFNEQMLIKFLGWTDGRPAKYYMELNVKDTFRQFFKNGG